MNTIAHSPITIQTFFPTGDTRGYRIAEVTNSTVEALLIPRKELESVLCKRPELESSGLYFLFGKEIAENQHAIEAYIGESEVINERLKHHNKNKDFWDIAIVFVSSNHRWQLNKADIKYMERQAYEMATNAQRYYINQTVPTLSNVTESREADLKALLHTVDILLTALGYPVFSRLVDARQTTDDSDSDTFYLTNRKSDAKGVYTLEGFVVLKGSKMSPLTTSASFSRQGKLTELIENNIVDNDGIFQDDYLFSSPSAAAGTILKGSYNGWDMWKNKQKQSLSDVYRNKA